MKKDDFSTLNATAHRFLLKQAKAQGKQTLLDVLRGSGVVSLPAKRRGSLVFVLARAIVGQQVSAKVAAVFWQRILDQATATTGGGGRGRGDKALLALFHPRNQKRIKGCGLSHNKTRFLVSLGETIRAGELSARRVIALTHSERVDYLTQLDGIGVWTADMVGIFYCRDKDIWPEGDLAVRTTFARLTGADVKETKKATEMFAPYRSFLALHMWSEKNNPMRA